MLLIRVYFDRTALLVRSNSTSKRITLINAILVFQGTRQHRCEHTNIRSTHHTWASKSRFGMRLLSLYLHAQIYLQTYTPHKLKSTEVANFVGILTSEE